MTGVPLAVALFLRLAAVPAAAAESPRVEEALRDSVLRLAAGDVAGAESAARAAVAADAASARALQQLARAANAALDFPTAEEAAGRALALEAPTPAVLCLRSEARSGRGDYDGALADAQAAARLNPASGTAALRVAVAKEGLRRPPEESLADYRRAADLDPALAPVRDAAVARLAPPARKRRGLGSLVAMLAVAGFVGWFLGTRRRSAPAARASVAARPALSGAGRLTPREASRALTAAASSAADPEASRALAESLYERLTGRPPFAPEEAAVDRDLGRFARPSSLAEGLPIGVDAFFARALDPKPERRFPTGAQLAGAFRSLVDPAVD